MSRRGICFDNAAMGNFFGHLKSEMDSWVKLGPKKEVIARIDDYICVYNNERIRKN
jgi:putative transposase